MSGMLDRYEALIASGELRPDEDQLKATKFLDQLQRQIESIQSEGGFLSKLLGPKAKRPRGLYMWGGVGRGKSMLMDLFHETLELKAKRRVHFHAFMLEVDQLVREERKHESGDPIRTSCGQACDWHSCARIR